MTLATLQRKRSTIWPAPASLPTAIGGRRPSSSSSTRSGSTRTRIAGTTSSIATRAFGTVASRVTVPTRAIDPDTSRATFRPPPMDKFQDLRSEMVLTMKAVGIDVEVHHHEVGTRRPGRDRYDVRAVGHDGRQYDALQVHCQECRLRQWLHSNVHAQAALLG